MPFSAIRRILSLVSRKPAHERGDKPIIVQKLDLFYWYLKYHEVLPYYYAYGFHRWQNRRSAYFALKEYITVRERFNRQLIPINSHLDYFTLTGDKFVTNTYLQGLSLGNVHNLALLSNSRIITSDHRILNSAEFFREMTGTFFFKRVHESGGCGVYKITNENGSIIVNGGKVDYAKIESELMRGLWVIQRGAIQHDALSAFYQRSVNTLRINTILSNRVPTFFLSFQKFATGTSDVDNWDTGSLLIPISDSEGTLGKFGYYKPGTLKEGTCSQHPDSGLVFGGFKVPYYREAVELALKAHEYYYGRVIVGWDIIITNEGPVILEANSYPDIYPLQVLYGGLKQRFTEIMESNRG
jgi:hypothetical protein